MNIIKTKGFTEMTSKEMITTDGGCIICTIGSWMKKKLHPKKK